MMGISGWESKHRSSPLSSIPDATRDNGAAVPPSGSADPAAHVTVLETLASCREACAVLARHPTLALNLQARPNAYIWIEAARACSP